MCNIVTEFYLYSIVYIYLIKSRLDVTFSVRHHFRIKPYHIRPPTMGKDKHKDGETAATSETNTQDGHQDSQRDHSQDQETRDATLGQTIAEAVAREVVKAHAH